MMNTRTFLNAAAVTLGLAVTATSSAQVAPDADPSRMTQEQREAYRAQRQSDMAAMTPEQRAEAKASRSQAGGGQGTMARDGSGTGGQQGKSGGQGGGRGKGR